jgi:hypothetical protein
MNVNQVSKMRSVCGFQNKEVQSIYRSVTIFAIVPFRFFSFFFQLSGRVHSASSLHTTTNCFVQAIALLLSASFRFAPFRSFIRAIAFSEKKLHFTAKIAPSLSTAKKRTE